MSSCHRDESDGDGCYGGVQVGRQGGQAASERWNKKLTLRRSGGNSI